MIARETIYAGLFTIVSGSAGFVTKSRKLQHVQDVPAVNQPALFQIQGHQSADATFNLPTKWRLKVDLYVYAHASNPGADGNGATLLNTLVDAIVTALEPDKASGRQTLGGLVSHCAIDGDVETDEGLLGEQAIAVLPIVIIPYP